MTTFSKHAVICLMMIWASTAQGATFLKIKKTDVTNFPEVKILVGIQSLHQTNFKGLSASNFQVSENGWLVNYLQSRPMDSNGPRKDIIILFSNSKYMNSKAMALAKHSAMYFLDTFSDTDTVALISYASEPKLQHNFTSFKDSVKSTLSNFKKASTGAKLYDSLFYCLKLAERVKNRQKAIVVFGDGYDIGSNINEDDLIGYSGKIETPIYFVDINGKKKATKQSKLARIAHKTGGEFITPMNTKSMVHFFSMVASSYEYDYVLKYKSLLGQNNDSSPRSVDLEVKFSKGAIIDSDQTNFEVKPAYSWKRFFDGDIFIGLIHDNVAAILNVIN